jgi:tetratricopeptide (TPR) repeat protein
MNGPHLLVRTPTAANPASVFIPGEEPVPKTRQAFSSYYNEGRMNMPEMNRDLHLQVQQMSADGDMLAESGQYSEALDVYWRAFDLLPAPKEQWEAATWLLAAIGDANFLNQDYIAGRDNLSVAMRCPGGIGNPFLHLRLGQCQFEIGALEKAADELARAYMSEGREIFEDEDPKYFAFLQTISQEPEGGW